MRVEMVFAVRRKPMNLEVSRSAFEFDEREVRVTTHCSSAARLILFSSVV